MKIFYKFSERDLGMADIKTVRTCALGDFPKNKHPTVGATGRSPPRIPSKRGNLIIWEFSRFFRYLIFNEPILCSATFASLKINLLNPTA